MTNATKYLAARKIDTSVAPDHILDGHYTFNGERHPAVGFAYRSQEPVAIKWRATDTKLFSQQNACRDLFLVDTYKDGNDLLICEGEFDALAWLSAGVPEGLTVVSIPNGAPAKVSDGKVDPTEDKKFSYIWSARDIIEAAPRIYINADADEPGAALKAELIRRLPTHKLYVVDLGGPKDANAALVERGADHLRSCLSRAKPVPMVGVHGAEDYEDQIHNLYRNGELHGAWVGLRAVDRLISVPLGMMTVVTGFPSAGKSDFIDQMCVNLAQNHAWKTVYCSFEKPPELHQAQLAEKVVGKPFFRDKNGFPRMTQEEMEWALSWINDHFLFMDYRKGSPADITGILSAASQAVMRMGSRVLVIDPYNFVDRPNSMTETEWVSVMLTEVSRWCKSHDCHVFFVAHPAKTGERGQNAKKYICTGVDISGSANWFNKTDIGLTLHRDENDNNSLHVWKVRYSWIGQPGASPLDYEPANSRWSDAVGSWKSRVDHNFDWSMDGWPPLLEPLDGVDESGSRPPSEKAEPAITPGETANAPVR